MLIALVPASASVAACPYPAAGWTKIADRDALPAGVRAAFGPMAASGEPFNPSDIGGPGLPVMHDRFVSARGEGCALELRYDHGGRAYARLTARFRYADGRWSLVSRR